AFLHRNGPLTLTSKEIRTQVIVVFGSDHGMCGNYNQIVATKVSKYLDTLDTENITPHVLCVGAQLTDALNGQDIWPESTLLPPASADGIGRLAGEIVTRTDDIRQKTLLGEITVTLIFTEQMLNGQQEPVTKILLPLEATLFGELADRPWVSRSLPDFNMPSNDLLSSLIRSHLFASIFRASAEALVTENAARFTQMQHAEQSVDDRLEELKSETRMVRQTDITNELMDVIIGFEALKKGRRKTTKQ
ncbi:MAG: F0F1 ATP synthase subunit gamma, partial [Alphaproteobacteria bacterium]